MTTQVLIHLPTDLANRFRQSVPARNRSGFVRALLEKYLPDTDDVMYQAALQAQSFDDAHPQELDALNIADQDGLDPLESFDTSKLNALCPR